MEKKAYLKSTTILFLIVAIIIVMTNVMGIGEATPGKTYGTMTKMEGREYEQIKNFILLLALGGAIGGRACADKPLGRKRKK